MLTERRHRYLTRWRRRAVLALALLLLLGLRYRCYRAWQVSQEPAPYVRVV